MKFQKNRLCFVILSLLTATSLSAQYPVKIHSHNDYTRLMPFYEAYSQKVYSIEADMFYQNGDFFVSHNKEDIDSLKTFETLYLNPLLVQYKLNRGRAWADADRPIQLLIDIKSENASEFMEAFVKLLAKYPNVFNQDINRNAVRVVMTGNEPLPSDFSKYPNFISFDGRLGQVYTDDQLKRLALFSEDFGEFSHWNGKGVLTHDDKKKLVAAIDKAHHLGKEIRFWGSPDGKTAWNTFYWLGIDYINTDKVELCADFFRDWNNKNYEISSTKKPMAIGITNTDLLDKTTHDFSGFQDDEMQLAKNIETYIPTHKNDGMNFPVKNVILLIGDGMGLAQITTADRINKGLSLFNMRYMGLINTSSKDAFTTDSAAGGSAFSCGHSVSNRSICTDDDGKAYPLITDYFLEKKKACGVVTLGDLADATPAVFYAHHIERDSSDAITRELLKGKLTLLAGSGMKVFTQRNDKLNLVEKLKKNNYRFVNNVDDINADSNKVICVDEEMGKAANADNIDLLARTTHQAIEKLSKSNSDGFFLMVEGAKIDYAGHANCLPGSVLETFSFDMAVAEALKFADQNGETLVVVTSDHETGGLTLIDGNNESGRVTAYYVTNDHTPIYVPVLAYGPQSQSFIGRYCNYQLQWKMKALLLK